MVWKKQKKLSGLILLSEIIIQVIHNLDGLAIHNLMTFKRIEYFSKALYMWECVHMSSHSKTAFLYILSGEI